MKNSKLYVLIFWFFLFLLVNKTLAQKADLIIPKGHTTPVVLLDHHERNSLLASSQGNDSYTIWNYEVEKEIRQITFHESPISALAFHPKFSQSISGDGAGRIITFDIEKNRKRSDRFVHNGPVRGILFDREGEHFFTFSDDSTIKKINYSYFRIIQDMPFEDKVKNAVYLEGKDIILASLANGALVSINNKSVKQNFKNENSIVFLDMVQYQGEDKFLGISKEGQIAEIDIKTHKVQFKKQIPLKVKECLRIDSMLIIAGRGSEDLMILDINTLNSIDGEIGIRLKKELDPFNISLQTIDANKDSSILFVPDYDYSIIGFDLNKNNEVRRFEGFTERIKEIDIAPNGYMLGVASRNNGLRLYDVREIIDHRKIENSKPAFSIDFSPDGLFAAVSGKDSLYFYNTDYFEIEFKYPLKAVYPDGNTLFLNRNIFAKKDDRDGLTIFNLEEGTSELLKVKNAYEFKTAFPKNYFAVKSGADRIYIFETDRLKKKKKIKSKDIVDFGLLPSKDILVVISGEDNKKLSTYDKSGKLLKERELPGEFDDHRIKILNDKNQFLSWKVSVSKSRQEADYSLKLWSLDSLNLIRSFTGLQSAITSVGYDTKRGYVIASSEDGSIKIWSLQNNQAAETLFPASIYPLNDLELVTMLENGTYDATRSAMENMHYVQGMEYISLDQIKEKYYEPKLLSKIFDYNKQEIMSRSPINRFKLHPEIKLQHPSMNGGVLGIDLVERGGGLGEVYVYINKKKAKEFDSNENEIASQIKYNIENHPFLKPNEINEISVRASNISGDLVSSPKKLNYIWNTDAVKEEKKFYALIVGISDYTGSKLDLQFASKDAADISRAIRNGAANYFGEDNVLILELNSENSNINHQPSKVNTIKSIQEIAKGINPQDVFLFYFAGHGVQGKEDDKNYYLLTQEASYHQSKELKNPEEFAISDKELSKLLGDISSHNMVMILDACHSGDIINKFNTDIAHINTKEEKALEKLISETGLHILAGSESEDVSYETSLYGQGLLTYSLLFGMKGEALRDGQYLDVNRLFQYASSKVPELAKNVGGVQKPVVKIPKLVRHVDIGEYSNDEKSQIELISPRPILLPSSFQEESLFLDIKNIGLVLDDELKFQAAKTNSNYVFINTNNFTGAYKFSGRYQKNTNVFKLVAKVFRDNVLLDIIEIEDNDLDLAIRKMAKVGLGLVEQDFNKRN